MLKKHTTYLAPLLLVLAFFLEGQVSSLATNLAPYGIVLTSHLLLILGLFCAIHLPLGYSLTLFSILGFLQDIYYLQVVGIATTFLPLVVYLMYYFYQSVHFRLVTNLLILFVVIFIFEFAGFVLARFFGLTTLSVFIFVFNGLLPSLIFNGLLLLILQPMIEPLFGMKHKK